MTYEINKKRVARKIEDIRKSLDLTMPEFAERIGVTKGAVNNYEKGRAIPKSAVLSKIIKLSDTPSMSENDFLHDGFRNYLIELFSELPNFSMKDKNWKRVLDKLESLYYMDSLDYGEESRIFREVYRIDKNLASTEFLSLWTEYISKQKDYKVSEDDVFKNDIVPLFERDFLDLDDEFKNEAVTHIIGVLSAMKVINELQYDGEFYNEIGEDYIDIINEISYLYNPEEVKKWSEGVEIHIAREYRTMALAWNLFLVNWARTAQVPLNKFLRHVADTLLSQKQDVIDKETEESWKKVFSNPDDIL
ncbi:helix-turn-helix domain-containing protein [Streptococcus hyointestinalis]|nr:helix-turn-helix transcriptional regulator [Streptococcus hyointestinalis]